MTTETSHDKPTTTSKRGMFCARMDGRYGPPDGGWAWLVVVASFINITLLPMPYFTFSVLLVDLKEHYDLPISILGLLGSVQIAVMFCCNIISGPLVKVYGTRAVSIFGGLVCATGLFLSSFVQSIPYLFVTFSLLSGAGDGLAFLPSSAVVMQYFDKHRPLAGGISICGLSIGTLAGPPIMRILIDTYGWRGALLILSGIILQTVIASCAFRPLPYLERASTNGSSTGNTSWRSRCVEVLDFSLWANTRFLLYSMGTCFAHIGIITFIQHSVNFAVLRGIDKHTSAMIAMWGGVATLLTRLVASFVANHPNVNRILQYGVSCIVSSLPIICSFLATSYNRILIQMLSFGASMGIMITIQATVLVELLGIHRFPTAFGMASAINGFGYLLASPIFGLLLDSSGSYDWPLAMVGGVHFIGGVILTTLNIIKGKSTYALETEDNNMKSTISRDVSSQPLSIKSNVDENIL